MHLKGTGRLSTQSSVTVSRRGDEETHMITPEVYSSPGSTSFPDSSRPLVISNVASIDAATSQRVDCAMWLPGQILLRSCQRRFRNVGSGEMGGN